VRAFQSNPSVALERLSEPVRDIADEHPQLAEAITEKLYGDYQYLASKLPAPLTRAERSLTPEAAGSRVPRAEQRKFLNIVEALEDPASVIEDLVDGKVPREKIEALKVRRPELFNEIRTMIIAGVAERKKEIPFLTRVRLSLAFDFDGDKSLEPATLRAIQASNRPEEEEPAPGQQGSAALDPKMTEAALTPSQQAGV
jgi:hypothetical protein